MLYNLDSLRGKIIVLMKQLEKDRFPIEDALTRNSMSLDEAVNIIAQ